MSGPVYAESSAVLAWLLGETAGEEVAGALREADGVVASDLTLVECERVLIRAWASGLMSEAQRADQSAALARAAAHWTVLRVDQEVVERARRPFPIEPLRTLDALHLSSALIARSAVPGLELLTLDQRVRENADRLGFTTVP
ncbi:MAG TPA: type II toxin-antitoxin system VapC family toxin [Longimicrobiales bacterium]|nr:type II toxin-antitoxin system VapC family toxin [Longimicrobiales bacterium]